MVGPTVLRIDDSAGPWELELKLPERRYGHLHRQLQQGDVPVQFRLASDPERRREGTVSDVGLRAEVSVDGQSYVPVIVDVPPAELPRSPRAGATVTARMSCGRRSRGFVWFHQVAEYIRQRLLL